MTRCWHGTWLRLCLDYHKGKKRGARKKHRLEDGRSPLVQKKNEAKSKWLYLQCDNHKGRLQKTLSKKYIHQDFTKPAGENGSVENLLMEAESTGAVMTTCICVFVYLDSAVIAGWSQPLPIWTEGHAPHCLSVSLPLKRKWKSADLSGCLCVSLSLLHTVLTVYLNR